MTEPTHQSPDQPGGERAPIPARDRAFTASVEGFTPAGAEFRYANTVTVSLAGAEDPALAEHVEAHPEEIEWAADLGWRQLVRMDTNYKPSRPGTHPVDLTREDAVWLAAALLAAVDDTFHYSRVGQLRSAEAARLLRCLASWATC